MEIINLYHYLDMFANVLSFGHELGYSFDVLEKRISKHKKFLAIELDNNSPNLYLDRKDVLKEIFFDSPKEVDELIRYNECEWVADMYLHLEAETGFTFELLFLYIPLERAYEMFPIYHEMDFAQSVDYFNEIFKKTTPLELLMKKKSLNGKKISEICGISYSTIMSIKNGQRDIKNLNSLALLKLTNLFNVRSETLLAVNINDLFNK